MSPVLLGIYGLSFQWQKWNPSNGGREWILDQVSFEVASGEILAVLGPNGSGKSTLLKAISGVISLDRPGCSGTVRYIGQDFLKSMSYRRAQCVAYVAPDLKAEFPLTVEEVVALGRTCQSYGIRRAMSDEDREIIHSAMKQCLCLSLKNRYIHSLSDGERQLVALARALAQGSRVLLLDETLSRMDLNHQAAMGNLLKTLASQGKAILLISHDLNLASEWSASALLLKDGRRIYHGPNKRSNHTSPIFHK